jgi:hypothetical protein
LAGLVAPLIGWSMETSHSFLGSYNFFGELLLSMAGSPK